MAFLSENTVPYQQYIHSSTYSMVAYLKFYYDYTCFAIYPYLSNGWNRPNAYNHFGFDESLFIDDFKQEDLIRDYVSDQEMFEKIIDIYEDYNDESLFLFGVSMQNHGGYEYSDFDNSITLENVNDSSVNQYLSLIHETDKAVEYLIDYFSKVDDEVVVVFFGDHQPRLDESFYSESSDSLDIKQNRYKVPFFIWTNYDIEEKNIECTSLNYLSNYVYESAHVELPLYNQFLSELEDKIPVINSNGFYSLDKNCFISFDDASNDEKRSLELYEILQYNNMFDAENRNKDLFVTIE